ncbi:MAG: helix-turn-helix transcriptional regulator [Sphingomonadales bacterium]
MVEPQATRALAGMDVRRDLGLQLRRLREAHGLSQEELAHSAEIHVTYLSGLENGKRNPSLLVLGRIAEALSIKISGLFENI